jgi:glucan phosphoethanolaminetransferase (alkaline phosphatase superfamily)
MSILIDKMPEIQFVIAIIGLIVCIRIKSRFARIGIVFFSLVVLQLVYSVIESKFIIPHFTDMAINKEIDEEMFGRYVFMSVMLWEMIDIASVITIIVGVMKGSRVRN